jgi:C1A family cysteine protease
MALFTTRMKYGLGAFPSVKNAKMLGFPAHLIVRSGDFPVRAFITGALGPVKDQGQQGSCTGHGSTSQGERLYRRFGNQLTNTPASTPPIFSPAFHYYNERQIEGTLAQGDCGAQVVTSLEVAENSGKGFCPESLMPYSDAECSTAPSAAALAAALLNPGGSFHSLGNEIANMKSCIISDYSAVIGISVYDSFEDDAAALSGLIPLPNLNTETLQGGHEVHALIGFDDTIQCPNAKPGAMLFQNSWGVGWGIAPPVPTLSKQRGFAWLPYDYLMDSNLTSDCRMQHLGKPW